MKLLFIKTIIVSCGLILLSPFLLAISLSMFHIGSHRHAGSNSDNRIYTVGAYSFKVLPGYLLSYFSAGDPVRSQGARLILHAQLPDLTPKSALNKNKFDAPGWGDTAILSLGYREGFNGGEDLFKALSSDSNLKPGIHFTLAGYKEISRPATKSRVFFPEITGKPLVYCNERSSPAGDSLISDCNIYVPLFAKAGKTESGTYPYLLKISIPGKYLLQTPQIVDKSLSLLSQFSILANGSAIN